MDVYNLRRVVAQPTNQVAIFIQANHCFYRLYNMLPYSVCQTIIYWPVVWEVTNDIAATVIQFSSFFSDV